MAAASYSFLDVAVLDEVRGRLATGDALLILSTDLEEVIWANGPGAALFGYSDIMAAMGAPSRFGPAARRQIAATSGFPTIGRNRAILVRMTAGLNSRPSPSWRARSRCRTARRRSCSPSRPRRAAGAPRPRPPEGRSAASPKPATSWPSWTTGALSKRRPKASTSSASRLLPWHRWRRRLPRAASPSACFPLPGANCRPAWRGSPAEGCWWWSSTRIGQPRPRSRK